MPLRLRARWKDLRWFRFQYLAERFVSGPLIVCLNVVELRHVQICTLDPVHRLSDSYAKLMRPNKALTVIHSCL